MHIIPLSKVPKSTCGLTVRQIKQLTYCNNGHYIYLK